jgi:hypothetical protein
MDTKVKSTSAIRQGEFMPVKRFRNILCRRLCLLVFVFSLGSINTFGQGVGISEVSIVPHPSSILELRSDLRGLLVPRMTTAERDAILNPANGLIVYNEEHNSLNIYEEGPGTWRIIFSGFSSGVNSVTGTMNRISIGGTPSDPVIDIDGDYIGQPSITTLGTITAGTWNAGTIPVLHGGTGLTTFGAINTVLYTSSADVLAAVPASTSAGQFLQTTTVGGAPSWKTVLDVVNGGTNSGAALSGSSIMISDGSAIVQGDAGTTSTVLHGNASGAPFYGPVVTDDIADLNVTAGKLAADAVTTVKILDANVTRDKLADNAVNASKLAVAGDGTPDQVLISNGDGTFSWSDQSALTPDLSLGDLTNVGDDSETSANILIADGDSWESRAVSGDAGISNSGVVTVDRIHGATLPVAGALTTGNVLQVSGTSSLAYGPLNIAGGSDYITGVLPVSNGGTGAANAGDARTNLGLVIGTDVQAYDAGLASIAGLTTAADQMLYTTESDAYAVTSLTSAGRALLDDVDASAQRGTLGLGTISIQDADNVSISGGTIDGTTVGGTTPAAGTFTTISSTDLTVTNTITGSVTGTASNVTGIVGIAQGGTNSGTALSGSSIMISNGSAIVQGDAGTTSTVLHGNASGAPFYGPVVTDDIADLNVTAGKLAADAVTTVKILDANVTRDKLADNAVNALKLAVAGDGTPDQVLISNGDGTFSWSDQSALTPDLSLGDLTNVGDDSETSANILIADGDSWESRAVSGDAGISNSGVVTVDRIHGATLPVAGALTTGNVLQVTGANSLAYGPLNIAGGSDYIAGVLPAAYGGTGVNNGTNTITLGGNINTAGSFSTSGANGLTLTTTGLTDVTLPATGILATTAGNETFTNKVISAADNTITGLTNANLSGSAGITNANLANSSLTIGTTLIALGGTSTTLAGLTSVSSTGFTGNLTGDVTGDLTGDVTGSLFGNATTATTATNIAGGVAGGVPYQTAASTTALLGAGTAGQVLTSGGSGAPTWETPTVGTVTGVSGTADRITVDNSDAANPVIDISSGYIGQSSITTLGTITTGIWSGSIIGPAYGGTGVNNGTNTITLGGNINTAGSFSTSGANGLTLTTTGLTDVTLPATGILATTAGNETFTNKVISAADNTITGLTNANLSGSAGITNANLANSSLTIGTTLIALGGTSTTLAGLTSVSSTGFTGNLTGDVTGDLTGDVTGSLFGNATTATTATNIAGGVAGGVLYQTAASTTALLGAGTAGQVLTSGGSGAPTWETPTVGTVTGVSGTADRITVDNSDAANPVIDISSGYIGQSSITTLGTITTGIWSGSIIGPAYGGTGVNNGTNTITLGGNINTAGSFSTSGANGLTLTTTGANRCYLTDYRYTCDNGRE